MSEYQYYEFQAIDRKLTAADMQALRALSSRAEITSASFVNTYNYGDFRGSPETLMEKYFDAHVYVANWGTRRLMLRVPRRLTAQAGELATAQSDPKTHARSMAGATDWTPRADRGKEEPELVRPSVGRPAGQPGAPTLGCPLMM